MQSYSSIGRWIRFDFDTEKGVVKCDEITRNKWKSWLRAHNSQNIEENIEENVEENIENDDIIIDDNIVHINCAIEHVDDAIIVWTQDNLLWKK